MMSHEEYLELKKQLINDFNSEYKRLDDCERQVQKEDEKNKNLCDELASMKVEHAKDSTKLSVVIGILSAIAIPLVSLCVKLLFQG